MSDVKGVTADEVRSNIGYVLRDTLLSASLGIRLAPTHRSIIGLDLDDKPVFT
jgi:hypothetical protein